MSVEGTSVSCGIWCCYCAITGCCITSSHPRFSAEHCTSLQWRNNIFGSLPEVVQCKSNSQFNILTSLSICVAFVCFVLPQMKLHSFVFNFDCTQPAWPHQSRIKSSHSTQTAVVSITSHHQSVLALLHTICSGSFGSIWCYKQQTIDL